MTDPADPTRAAPADAVPIVRLPERTTPTWEIELLISAAVVFALFQALEALDLAFDRALPAAPATVGSLLTFGYLYAKIVLFLLIPTFVLHIAARAAWISLLGAHSVFPQGPRWQNYSGGPIGRRVAQAVSPPVAEAIERADNRASVVFAFGILAAQFALLIALWSVSLVALAEGIGWLWPAARPYLMQTLLAVSFGPLVLAGLIDLLLGKRLAATHAISRAVAWLLCQYSRITLMRITDPLLALVTTNVGGKRGIWLLTGLIYLAIAAAFLDINQRIGRLQPLRGDALAELRRDSGVHPAHYADQRRGRWRWSDAPMIPSEVADGPYLRLFVPYAPNRHDEALAQRCPAPPTATGDPATRAAAAVEHQQAQVACLGGLLQLRLDGQHPPTRFERHHDTFSGHDGLLAMIDVRELAAGQHLLEIQRLPLQQNTLSNPDRPADPPDRILFWR